MHLRKDQLTIGYVDFVQLYREDRILTYTMDGFTTHCPIANLIHRKKHLAETLLKEQRIQPDWVRAAQLRENMFWAHLSDEDFIYLQVCVHQELSDDLSATTVTVMNEDGMPQSVYVTYEEAAFKQQVLTPRTTSGQPVAEQRLLHS